MYPAPKLKPCTATLFQCWWLKRPYQLRALRLQNTRAGHQTKRPKPSQARVAVAAGVCSCKVCIVTCCCMGIGTCSHAEAEMHGCVSIVPQTQSLVHRLSPGGRHAREADTGVSWGGTFGGKVWGSCLQRCCQKPACTKQGLDSRSDLVLHRINTAEHLAAAEQHPNSDIIDPLPARMLRPDVAKVLLFKLTPKADQATMLHNHLPDPSQESVSAAAGHGKKHTEHSRRR